MKTYLIVDGDKKVKEYQKEFQGIMREYRKTYRGWGYTFKKVMPKGATKPYYYWYKWEYDSATQNNVWTYIGKEKPTTEIPDPPVSRLDDVMFQVVGENIMITEEELAKVEDLFEGCIKFEVNV